MGIFFGPGLVSLGREKCTKCCNRTERDYFEDLSVAEVFLLKGLSLWTGFICHTIVQWPDIYRHGNYPSASVKEGKFLD